MSRLIRISVVVLLLGLALGAQTRTASKSVVDQIQQMKKAAVQIRYVPHLPPAPSTNAPPNMPAPPTFREPVREGSGFLVTKQGYVLTNAHVIQGAHDDAKTKGFEPIVFQVGILLDPSSNGQMNLLGSFEGVSAEVVAIDSVHDLALLKLNQNPFTGELRSGIVIHNKPLPAIVDNVTLDAMLPPEGDNLLITGYPLEIATAVTQRGMVASESFTYFQIPLSIPNAPPGLTRTQFLQTILVDAVINPGNSGGPVYREGSGSVVGICEAYENSPLFTNLHRAVQVDPNNPNEILVQNAGLAMVIPIKYAIEFLEKHGVSDPSIPKIPISPTDNIQ